MCLVLMLFRTNPLIPELDFSGTVVKAGKKVPASRDLVMGAAVFGSIPLGQHVTSGKGALAEYVVVPAASVCLKPDSVPFDQAAGLPIAGISALSVIDLAKLKIGTGCLLMVPVGELDPWLCSWQKRPLEKMGKSLQFARRGILRW